MVKNGGASGIQVLHLLRWFTRLYRKAIRFCDLECIEHAKTQIDRSPSTLEEQKKAAF